MAEWLYEAGIGENRALLIDGDDVLAARLERPIDGIPAGARMMARLVEPKIVELDGGKQLASLQGRAPVPQGGRFLVEVTRMALKERGREKLARVRPAAEGEGEAAGETLLERLQASGVAVRLLDRILPNHDPLEAAGWSEMVERAQRGHWEFAGGALWIDPTPAMVVIDIDGDGEALALGRAGARACVAAIEGFDLGGPIGIDFPSLKSRVERAEMDGLIDAHLPQPFERTGTNGFGFMQIIRRRLRPSFLEQLRYDPAYSDATALIRRAERAQGVGDLELLTRPAVADVILGQPQWIASLQQRTGRTVKVKADAAVKGSGHAQ